MLNLIRRGENLTNWPKPNGMDDILYRLLAARGIDSDDAALKFLNPSVEQLHDPFLLSDMDRAVDRIRAAKENGETVCVYGDYDVDGVSATAILTLFLREWGVDARPYIPSRHEEGYGLNATAVESIAQWAKLMITVDCGITAREEIRLAKFFGLSAIVTDHHEPGERLPDCPLIDPLLGDYPFRKLCGAGVALKLITALNGELPMQYIDLAALATVADIVPLLGENRAIVAAGLRSINFRPRPGVQALMEVSGLKPGTITAENIAYQLGPRLNAGGRIGDANRSLKLLMAETMDEAMPIAKELNEENQNRRGIEQAILEEAMAQIADYDFARHRAIVLAGADWNPGVIGISASRLVEKFHFPTILLSEANGMLTGSCRSIDGVDIHAALTDAKDLLVRFGGHKQAAGLMLEKDQLPGLIDRLDAYIEKNCDPEIYIPTREYDLDVPVEMLTEKLVDELSRLEPTGFDNPSPLFLGDAHIHSTKAIGRDEKHLKLFLSIPGAKPIDAVWFGAGHLAGPLCGAHRKLLYAPKINEYMGSRTVQCMVQSAVDPDEVIWPDDAAWTVLLHDFLTSALYNDTLFQTHEKRFTPDGAAEKPDYLDDIRVSPRGTLLIAATLDSAKAAEARLRAEELMHPGDWHFGAWPDDPRGFNAVCVLPAGEPSRGFSRLYYLDEAAARCAPVEGIDAIAVDPQNRGWLDDLPDIDDLRSVYVAAKKCFVRPYYVGSLERLVAQIAAECQRPHAGILAALMVLNDMDLLKFQARPPEVALRPGKKSNPEENRLFGRITKLKNG